MIPIGTEIRVATPVMTSVPTIACCGAAAGADHAAGRLGEEVDVEPGSPRLMTS